VRKAAEQKKNNW